MNEYELSHALRGTLAASSPPPGLDAQGMLARAKRARARRRGTVMAAGSALAVCAVAGSSALAGGPLALGSGGGKPIQVGGPGAGSPTACPTISGPYPTSTEITATKVRPSGGETIVPGDGVHPHPTSTGTSTGTSTATAAPTAEPSTPANCVADTQTPWPSGQTDRTAHTGMHAEQANTLQAALLGALPAGSSAVKPDHEAQLDSTVQGTEVWEIKALTTVRRQDGRTTGIVLVRMLTPKPGDNADLCTLAALFQGNPGPICHVQTVNGKQVAVATRRPVESTEGYGPDMQQWVVYRAPDGTALWFGQGYDPNAPHRTALPYTQNQLVQLAVSGRFAI